MGMRTYTLALCLAALGCGGSSEQDPIGRLRKLAVDPKELPDDCKLAWSARPFAMTPKKDAEVLGMMSRFWFGGTSAPASPLFRAALSNVYASPEDPRSSPLVLAMFDFLEEGEASSRLKQLQRKYPGEGYRFERRGSLLLIEAWSPPVDDACAEGAWSATLARLE